MELPPFPLIESPQGYRIFGVIPEQVGVLTQLKLIAQAQRAGGDPESAGRNAADRGGDPL
jgi:hypothetical protein